MKRLIVYGVMLAGALSLQSMSASAQTPYIGHGASPHGQAHISPRASGFSQRSPGGFPRGGHSGRDHDWAAGAAGVAAGALVGGALLAGSQGYYPDGDYPAYPSASAYPDSAQVYDQNGNPVYAAPGYAYEGAAGPGADPSDPSSVAYCEQTFKSYDPSSGTYLGYDGLRHACP